MDLYSKWGRRLWDIVAIDLCFLCHNVGKCFLRLENYSKRNELRSFHCFIENGRWHHQCIKKWVVFTEVKFVLVALLEIRGGRHEFQAFNPSQFSRVYITWWLKEPPPQNKKFPALVWICVWIYRKNLDRFSRLMWSWYESDLYRIAV